VATPVVDVVEVLDVVVELAAATAGMLSPIAVTTATVASDLTLNFFIRFSLHKNKLDTKQRDCESGVRKLLKRWEKSSSFL
jgi:hypothetical protein